MTEGWGGYGTEPQDDDGNGGEPDCYPISYDPRLIAPAPSPSLIKEIAELVMRHTPARKFLFRHYVEVGARHGFVRGWYAGHAAATSASAIEARSDATPQSGAAEGESATRKGDAQTVRP